MTYLDDVLAELGYAHRPQQDALFRHLLTMGAKSTSPDPQEFGGVIAQAGTGTGKSIAVLAAAAVLSHELQRPSLVVCPTNILLDQYIKKDAPAVAQALGVTIRSLKGRNRYYCASAPGWMLDVTAAEHVQRLSSSDIEETQDGRFGCPGSEECDPGSVCHYRRAKALLEDADIIVTNAHLMVIDNQLKSTLVPADELGEPDVPSGQGIFPALGAVFVDEAHTLEGVARGFTENAISLQTLNGMGEYGRPLAELLSGWETQLREPQGIYGRHLDFVLHALHQVAAWKPEEGEKPTQRRVDARSAAKQILRDGVNGVFRDGHRVLWIDPQKRPRWTRLAGTTITLSGMMRRVLTSTPYALVSATVPRSMAAALGVGDADFIDVGHPFNYGVQAKLGFSAWPGDFKSAQHDLNVTTRAAELLDQIINHGGGALLLFSSYRDLNRVYELIADDLRRVGLLVLRQEREGDKAALGEQFKADGNAVLFGSTSFATGFDCPGPALRFLAVWKLAYPGLDPVTKAISARSRQSYEDMMLVETVQGLGRLIRTANDYGTAWVADSRGVGVLLRHGDPMTAHLREFERIS